MSDIQIVDDLTKAKQLVCGTCLKGVFAVVLDKKGALCICQACQTKYRLESIGGTRVLNA